MNSLYAIIAIICAYPFIVILIVNRIGKRLKQQRDRYPKAGKPTWSKRKELNNN